MTYGEALSTHEFDNTENAAVMEGLAFQHVRNLEFTEFVAFDEMDEVPDVSEDYIAAAPYGYARQAIKERRKSASA